MNKLHCEPQGIPKMTPDRMGSNDLLQWRNMQITLNVKNKSMKQ